LVKDAQRHGLRVKPIDVQVSDWPCTVEHESDGTLSLRIGLGYARRLTRQAAEALVASRHNDETFRSTEDLAQRVPSLNRRELTRLAQIGALTTSTASSTAAMRSGRSSAPASWRGHCSATANRCAGILMRGLYNR